MTLKIILKSNNTREGSPLAYFLELGMEHGEEPIDIKGEEQ
jgi:hypothetical protein